MFYLFLPTKTERIVGIIYFIIFYSANTLVFRWFIYRFFGNTFSFFFALKLCCLNTYL